MKELFTEELDYRFGELVKQDLGLFTSSSQEYFKLLAVSDAKIKNQAIKSYFHPYFLTTEEYQEIGHQVRAMAKLIAKATELWFAEQEVRELFDFDPRLERVMQKEPGYETLVPIARYDAFYSSENSHLTFCEFNADGSSGMNETNTMEEAFLATAFGKQVQAKLKVSFCELRQTLLETLLANYRDFAGSKAKLPTIAIVDWQEFGTTHEFQALQKHFTQQGVQTVICDPRELSFKDGGLWHGQLQIDLVYRRAVTTDLLERWEEAQELIRAYEAGAICLVGSLRTEVAHNKLIFCLFSDPHYNKFFHADEQRFLAAHIPWTRKLSSDPVLYEEAMVRKDQLILKPHNAYGSRGVIMGDACTPAEWQESLRSMANQNYLVQEKIAIPEKLFVTGPETKENFKVNLSTFLYNEKLAGFYTRVSKDEIITTSRGGAVVPTLVSEK